MVDPTLRRGDVEAARRLAKLFAERKGIEAGIDRTLCMGGAAAAASSATPVQSTVKKEQEEAASSSDKAVPPKFGTLASLLLRNGVKAGASDSE